MNSKITRNELELFILDSDLEKLEKELNKFNLFDVLKSTHNEYLHSSIIRWLLDPEETHGLKDYFLKIFLKRVLFSNKSHSHLPLSPIEIDLFDFDDSLVQSEEVFSNRRRGDVSITNQRNKLYILIENKLNSGEGKQQTKEYVKETKKRYPDYKRIYIFLSPDGWAPEAEEFLLFSYQDFNNVINDVLTSKNEDISENVKFILMQLKRNIEVNILNESEVEKLCLAIYEKHKRAIDKIIEIKPSNKQIFDVLGSSVISELKEDWKYYATNSYCAIFREEWKRKFNPSENIPFFHYEFNDVGLDRIRIAIHIEKFRDQDLREILKEKLRKTDFIKIKELRIERQQVVLVKKSVNRIDNIDDATKKGRKDMIKLINETWKYLDDASKSI